MKIVSWQEWLDKHIPYYEAERHKNRFLDNPPCSVLIVYPNDEIRLRKHTILNEPVWEKYETITEQIERYGNTKTVSLFLERDTNQQWYWAFWSKNHALLTLLKL